MSYEFGDSLAYYTYRPDTAWDTLATVTALERAKWYGYGLGQEPAVCFDGGTVVKAETLYAKLDSMARTARSVEPAVQLSFDDENTVLAPPNVKVGVYVNPADSAVTMMPGLMLVAVVFEDSIAHPSFRGDTAYVPIAREVIGGAWGVPLSLTPGNVTHEVLEVRVGNWREDYLGVAVFVQDTASRKVLQAVTRRRIGK